MANVFSILLIIVGAIIVIFVGIAILPILALGSLGAIFGFILVGQVGAIVGAAIGIILGIPLTIKIYRG